MQQEMVFNLFLMHCECARFKYYYEISMLKEGNVMDVVGREDNHASHVTICWCGRMDSIALKHCKIS